MSFSGFVSRHAFCAGKPRDLETRCDVSGVSDFGSPLACEDKKGRMAVVGLFSKGRHCEPDRHIPGMYTEIKSKRQWIENTIEENTKEEGCI